MKRLIQAEFSNWKKNPTRKPMVLQGTRQVGKTYSLKQFGASDFRATHYVNFEENARVAKAFGGSLDPHQIIRDLSLELGAVMDLEQDLLVLDEIQQCPQALTSLKYFAEQMPRLAIAAAGSLLGVQLGKASYPVGKVTHISMYPLSFKEFLMAWDEPLLFEGFLSIRSDSPGSEILHERLWDAFKLYLIVGGLPEVVAGFVKNRDDLPRALPRARSLQKDLIQSHLADMAKHSGKQNSMHLTRLWSQAPAQLGRNVTGSAPKFSFKGVLPGIRGYARMASTIDWLTTAGLVIKLPIVNSGLLPFTAYERDNVFKLFVFDVGILGALAGLPPQTILDYEFGTYKGYLAENFVVQELVASGRDSLVCWREASAEVEFLCETRGRIIPVEVKSGWATQAKSLGVFSGKYPPPYAVVLSARNMNLNPDRLKQYYPIYLAARFLDPALEPSA